MSHQAPESAPLPQCGAGRGGGHGRSEREPGWGRNRAGLLGCWAAGPFLLLAFSSVSVPGAAFHISFPISPPQPKVGSYRPPLSLLSLLFSAPRTSQMPMLVRTSLF